MRNHNPFKRSFHERAGQTLHILDNTTSFEALMRQARYLWERLKWKGEEGRCHSSARSRKSFPVQTQREAGTTDLRLLTWYPLRQVARILSPV